MIENHKEIITYVKLMMSSRTFDCIDDIARTRNEIREYVESVCKDNASIYMFGCRDFYGCSDARFVEICVHGTDTESIEITIPRG